MNIPKRKDCIHAPVCKFNDGMCAADCGHFEAVFDPSSLPGSSAGEGGGKGGTKNMVGLAAEYLEEWHVSGDTMVERDHCMDGVEGGSYYVHDIMVGFVKHLNDIWGDF